MSEQDNMKNALFRELELRSDDVVPVPVATASVVVIVENAVVVEEEEVEESVPKNDMWGE
jgi:hypothetical protein